MTQGATTGTVMVVEDDRDVREALADLIRDHGYQVMCAGDGADALAQLQTVSAPCVILLDLMMPVMDGATFRVEQQRDPKLADIPVVVISAGGRAQEAAQQMDAAGCFEKPIDVPALLGTIARLC